MFFGFKDTYGYGCGSKPMLPFWLVGIPFWDRGKRCGRDELLDSLYNPEQGTLQQHTHTHMAVGQNQWYHFGVGAPPILEPIVGVGMFTGGTIWILTHSHLIEAARIA